MLDVDYHKKKIQDNGYTSFTLYDIFEKEWVDSFKNLLYKNSVSEMKPQFYRVRADFHTKLSPSIIKSIVNTFNLDFVGGVLDESSYIKNNQTYAYKLKLFAKEKEILKKYCEPLSEEQIENIQDFVDYIQKTSHFISQLWLYDHVTDDIIQPLVKDVSYKILELLYPEYSKESIRESGIYKTHYSKNCFLAEHTDGGYENENIFGMLIYLNDRYEPNSGGQLTVGVGSNSITIPPLFGNIAIIDFCKFDPEHGVDLVKNDLGRYAFLTFMSSVDKKKIIN